MATAIPEIPALASDEAFEQLYRRYVKDVYHYSLALLRNPADAEDVTQTTFMNAYRAFRRGEEIHKPQNWLIKIAHNVARSRYSRMSRRVQEVPLEDHVERLAVIDDERPDVEGVLRALGGLPFNQRAALVMRELEGRSYPEIADTLSVSVAAVETLIFRARRSLRVRAAALKSIAAVPLPGSLTQFFEGGGAVAGGIGAGFVVKAAVALVVGALVTGAGGDRSNRADAAPTKPHPASRKAAMVTATPAEHTARTAKVRRSVVVVPRPRAQKAAPGTLRDPQLDCDPSAGAPLSGSTATTAAPAAAVSPTAQAAAPAPTTTATGAVHDTVGSTVDTAQQTAQQTVAAVTSAVSAAQPQTPVHVPSLPVGTPPLPALP
jgi:RNA polymerase sigma factor (sigma-70 family)